MGESPNEPPPNARMLIAGMIMLAVGPFAWANHRQIYGITCLLVGAALIISGLWRRYQRNSER